MPNSPMTTGTMPKPSSSSVLAEGEARGAHDRVDADHGDQQPEDRRASAP